MEIPDIKTVNELLDFVLTECGNSTFQYYSHNRELDMHEVGVLNYILYAYKLMEEKFGYGFKNLSLNLTDISEIPEDFFKEMNLEFLYCSDNHGLKKLPELPKNLKKLICCDSNLIELPELPDTLEYLSCEKNQLQKLPKLPEHLMVLDWKDNPGYEKGLIKNFSNPEYFNLNNSRKESRFPR